MFMKKLNIAMLGHKRIPSREGGIEIVVEELATRMVKLGHEVTCYNRAGHHVSGAQYDTRNIMNGILMWCNTYKGVKLKTVWTIDRKGLAAVTSSLSAAWQAIRGNYDVVHIHAEGPAAMCGLMKLGRKKVIVSVHGLDWARTKWKTLPKMYINGEKNKQLNMLMRLLY